MLIQGGNYKLYNCTIATYGNNKINHTDDPVAIITNYYYTDQVHHISAPLTADLRNCTITGSLDSEFVAERLEDSSASISLQNCLLKTGQDKMRPWVVQTNVQYNKDPLFTDIAKGNYRPKTGSPLIDSGTTYQFISATDLDEQPRSRNFAPDIGCYESQ